MGKCIHLAGLSAMKAKDDANVSNSVLMIDDDRALCDLVKRHLGNEALKVEVKHDGKEGLAKIDIL